MSLDLKPCPFCGHDAKFKKKCIACSYCGAEGPYIDSCNTQEEREEIAIAWNTRHESAKASVGQSQQSDNVELNQPARMEQPSRLVATFNTCPRCSDQTPTTSEQPDEPVVRGNRIKPSVQKQLDDIQSEGDGY